MTDASAPVRIYGPASLAIQSTNEKANISAIRQAINEFHENQTLAEQNWSILRYEGISNGPGAIAPSPVTLNQYFVGLFGKEELLGLRN